MQLGRKQSAVRMLATIQELLHHGTHEQYLSGAESAVKQFPNDVAIRIEYATALLPSRPDQAQREAWQAVGSDRRTDPAHLIRAARVFLTAGDRNRARTCAERALEAGSKNPVIVNELNHIRGEIAALDGDNALAEEYLTLAHTADPAHQYFALDLASVLVRAHRFMEARQVIDRTLALPRSEGAAQRDGIARLEELRDKLGKPEANLGRKHHFGSHLSKTTSTATAPSTGSVGTTSTHARDDDPEPPMDTAPDSDRS